MRRILLSFAAMAALLGYASIAPAETWDEDQTAVWSVVSKSWEDEVARNGKWPGDYIHADVVSWNVNWPAPRHGDSMVKWSRFSEKTDTTLMYELFPAAIVVVGDTAAVHYSVVTVAENYEKKRERETEGLIEVLVHDGGTWKFLSLTSFEMGSDD